jgi:spore maturation protein CgeB
MCQADQDILVASTPDEFIAKANQLITQPQLAKSIGQSALHIIQKYYSWQSQLQPLVNLLGSKDKQ